MKTWFEEFTACLRGEDPSNDLIGAGKASSGKAMEHYRYQHSAKIREAVEATFPELLRLMQDEWDICWEDFWQTSPPSPRSLDFYPEVFLMYFLSSNAESHLKELAKFEHYMEVHPWSHIPLKPIALDGLSEDSRLTLAHLDVRRFSAPVAGLYQEKEDLDLSEPQIVLLWLTQEGVQFRVMLEWEVQVLEQLHMGVGEALEAAPDDTEAVNKFFQWLGQSGLIQSIRA